MSVRAYLSQIFGPETKPCAGCGVQEGFMHLPGCTATRPLAYGTFDPKTGVPKPRLAAVRAAPSREDFDAWRDHHVTQFVFAALANAAAEQRKAWTETSWEGGEADKNLLLELRVRADAYNSMQEGAYEGFCEWAGVEPEAAVEQGEWAS